MTYLKYTVLLHSAFFREKIEGWTRNSGKLKNKLIFKQKHGKLL